MFDLDLFSAPNFRPLLPNSLSPPPPPLPLPPSHPFHQAPKPRETLPPAPPTEPSTSPDPGKRLGVQSAELASSVQKVFFREFLLQRVVHLRVLLLIIPAPTFRNF